MGAWATIATAAAAAGSMEDKNKKQAIDVSVTLKKSTKFTRHNKGPR